MAETGRSGERLYSDERVVTAARAMQATGHHCWRNKEWTGKAWRLLDWDEIPPHEQAVALKLARAALESAA